MECIPTNPITATLKKAKMALSQGFNTLPGPSDEITYASAQGQLNLKLSAQGGIKYCAHKGEQKTARARGNNGLSGSCRTREAAESAIRRFNGELIGHRRVRCDWAQHKQDPSDNDFNSVNQSDPDNSNGKLPLCF